MPANNPRPWPVRRTWAAGFALVALVILAGGYGFYRVETGGVRDAKFQSIAGIAELKAAQLLQWRSERLTDARRSADSPFFRRALRDWRDSGFAPEGRTVWQERLGVEKSAGTTDALLLDATGKILLATAETPESPGPATARAVAAALATREPALSDFYRTADGTIQLDAVAVVPDGGGAPLAVLVLRNTAHDYLYPLIQLWPTPSPSAETLLVRREGDEVVFLNELRHRPGTALALRMPLSRTDSPAVQAVLGRQGRFEGLDYRGVPVLADVRPLPGTPWFMVAKIDADEALAEVRYRAVVVAILVASFILLAAALIACAYRQQQAGLFRNLYQAERRQREAREVFRTTLYSIGDAVITTDVRGCVELLNPVAETLTGWNDAAARGRPLAEVFCIVDEETRKPVEHPFAPVLRDGQIAKLASHTVLLARDGTARPVADSGAPIRDERGAIAGMVLVFRDETGERAARRTLRESQRMLSSVLDTIPARVFWKDRQGKFLGGNAAFARDAGLASPDELIGKTDFQMSWKQDAARFQADDRQVVETGIPKLGFEEPQSTPGGGCLWLRTSKIPLRDSEGRTIGVLGTYEDITPRKVAEAAVRESEARFRSLFESNHTIMFVIDPESGAIVDANPAAAAYYGWPREELVAKNIAALNTLALEQIRAEMQVARDENRGHFNFRHRRADGSIRDVEVYSSAVIAAGRPLLYSLVFDITDRRQAEERIRRLNRTLAVLSDINQAIVRERDLLALHQETCRIAVEKGGFRLAWIGLLDAVTARVKPVAHAGEAADYLEQLDIDLGDQARAAGPTGAALRRGQHAICNDLEHDPYSPPWRDSALRLGFRSSGAFPLKVAGQTIGALNLYSGEPGFFDDEELTLLDELAMDLSFALEHADAEQGRRQAEEKVRSLAAFPELNPNPVLEFAADGTLAYANRAAHALAATAGVTDLQALLPPNTRHIVVECLALGQPCQRVETRHGSLTLSWSFYPIASQGTVHCYAGDITERLQLETRFRQAQKMEAIGQLAGGVAHDFNNLLTVIQGYCSLLLAGSAAADAEQTDAMKEIQAAANRAANLTRQLLTFSRRQPMQTRPLDLDDVVSNTGRMLQRLIGEDIVLHTRLLPGGAWIEGDSGMIEQVLLNLAVNARDAMPDGGELWLALDSVTLDEAAAGRRPAGRPGAFICLSLRDTGRGIAADLLPHIFEPFFTTKEVGKGTGLGLATVHSIVELHHGWIEVQSRSGEGTTFRVHLPRLPGGLALPGNPRDAAGVQGGHESILVVEDEPAVRALAVKLLDAQGYRVQAAHDGATALELWRQQAGAFDLLLTDLIMPGGVSGAQLAEQLRTEQPQMRVIYMSGYAGETAGRGLNLREGINFLQKPFAPAHLAKAVRAYLDIG